MSRQPRIRDLVEWRLPGPETRGEKVAVGHFVGVVRVILGAILVALALAGLDLTPGTGPDLLARRRLPRDGSAEIRGFRCVVVDGTVRWMPGKYADPAGLAIAGDTAWIVPPGLPRRIELDLAELRLVRLTPDHAMSGPTDMCSAEIASQEAEFTVRGPWLAIAWLGHLAGWPDPRVSGEQPPPAPSTSQAREDRR